MNRPINTPRKPARKPKTQSTTIAENRKARHDYSFEDRIEAGIALQGWELKSLRAGKGQLVDSFVLLRDGEAWLYGANISPLTSASTHVVASPQRARKLLLHRKEIARLFSSVQQKGYTCIALSLYWSGNRVKCMIALAKGKKEHDKRATERERDWKRDQHRIMKRSA